MLTQVCDIHADNETDVTTLSTQRRCVITIGGEMAAAYLLESEADFAPSQLEGPSSRLREDSSPRDHGHNDGAANEVANVAHNPALGKLLQCCLALKVLHTDKG